MNCGLHAVLRARSVLPQRSGATVHAWATEHEDVVDHEGIRVTSGAQAYLDMAAVLSPADLVALGDALLRTGRLTREALRRHVVRADRVRGLTRAHMGRPPDGTC